MKKYDLFELAIFCIGVWAAYQFVTTAFVVFANIVQLAFDDFRLENTQKLLVNNIILCVCYLLAAHFALRKSNDVMSYLKPGFAREEAELAYLPFHSKLSPFENHFDTSYLIYSAMKMLVPALLIIFSKRFTALLKF